MYKISSTKKESNYLKEIIKKGNEIVEINEIEKGMVELNLIKTAEEDKNNKEVMSDLKDLSEEKDKKLEQCKITILKAESCITTLVNDEWENDKEREEYRDNLEKKLIIIR